MLCYAARPRRRLADAERRAPSAAPLIKPRTVEHREPASGFLQRGLPMAPVPGSLSRGLVRSRGASEARSLSGSLSGLSGSLSGSLTLGAASPAAGRMEALRRKSSSDGASSPT
jgi:hypothetical protein